VKLVGSDLDVPELPTVPTTLQQASAAAQEVLQKLGQLPLDQLFNNIMGVSDGLNRLLNAPELFTLIRALGNTATKVQQLVQRTNAQSAVLLDELAGAAVATRATITDVQRLVQHADSRVVPLSDNLKETLETARGILNDTQQLVRHIDGRLGPLLDGVSDTSKVAQATLVQTQRTVDRDVAVMLQELTSTARAFRLLADYLERNPNALLYGKGSDRR
jgi:paraquat-inducible protein B